MKKITIIVSLGLAIILTSCSSSNDFNKGKEQLENMGYTDVKDTGHSWFCCDSKDKFSTGFEAKDKNGKTVEGCFCSGFLKGVTIRFK